MDLYLFKPCTIGFVSIPTTNYQGESTYFVDKCIVALSHNKLIVCKVPVSFHTKATTISICKLGILCRKVTFTSRLIQFWKVISLFNYGDEWNKFSDLMSYCEVQTESLLQAIFTFTFAITFSLGIRNPSYTQWISGSEGNYPKPQDPCHFSWILA